MGANVAVGDLVDGKYRIIRAIGEGGWGIVFEGENIRTYKRVAIKILRPHSAVTKDILTRFEREAQAAGRIGSEHIVEVYDLGSLEDETHYMVMELLNGQELAARLRDTGPMDPVAVARIVVQLLEGLKAAHEAGILHRDLKPENLFLVKTRSGEEFVKILDFGISKFNNNGPQGSATMTGAVLGSPCYMAPEQARGLKQIDARTDLYAVGTLMFESLTGRVPFLGDNFNDLMFKIVLAPRPDPRELRPDLDPDLASIVVKAMSIDPAVRFQNAESMSAALVEWLNAKGIASVSSPELKRALFLTPRSGSESNPAPQRVAITPLEKAIARQSGGAKPQWSDETMLAEARVETPLVSSASDMRLVKTTASVRKKTIAYGAVAAVVSVIAVAGLLLARGSHSPPVMVAPVDTLPGTGAAAAAATVVSTPPPVESLAVPVEAALPPMPSESAVASTTHRTSSGPTPRFAAPAMKSAPATSSSPKTPDVPAPAAAAPAKPLSNVEGREIRTGL